MAQKGLTLESIVLTATEMIENGGVETFSMHRLADKLGVKTASLYNHIESVNALILAVCRLGFQIQENEVLDAVKGKERDNAVLALAQAYYRYAKEHHELYRLMMSTASANKSLLEDAAVQLTDPLKAVLEYYSLSEDDKIHFRRMLRAIVHGFVSEEDTGFFSHNLAAPADSFNFAVRNYIVLLNQAERWRLQ